MEETKKAIAEIPTAEPVLAKSKPFYKTVSFWMIVIASIILVVIGIVIWYESVSFAGGITLVAFYAFAIILLIVGLLIAILA